MFQYENGKTFAEMSEKQKNDVSHRARAAEKMKLLLAEVL
ncbi:MAG: non-canonical purine NTP pyrophosphatase [Clostridia bacterium]